MRHLGTARRAGALTALAAAGVLCTAGPAAADVTVSPASAEQGSGTNVTYRYTNTGTAAVSRVTLRLPEDSPVAEVYPLSVDDWAPLTTTRTLSRPLTTIHGGSPVTQTTGAITWIAAPGTSLAPGATAELSVAMGPLPSVSSMRFTVTASYADGSPAPAMPPVVLTLTAGAGGREPAHHGAVPTAPAHPGAEPAAPADEERLFAGAVDEAVRGPALTSVAGWVVAALALAGMAVLRWRGRHRAAEEPEPDDEPGDGPADPDTTGSDTTGSDSAGSDSAGSDSAEPGRTGPGSTEPVGAGRWSLRH